MYPTLTTHIKNIIQGFSSIGNNRKILLDQLAASISQQLYIKEAAKLIFICTHNSRRSQLAEIWAKQAAEYYGLKTISTYSGGTESTAIYPTAIAALEKVGFDITKTSSLSNPKYQIQFREYANHQIFFSKKYTNEFNPQDGFLAIMVCSDADEKCPIVLGAIERISLPYIDPKIADGTTEETRIYEARSLEIATELFYVMQEVKKNR